MTVTGRKKNRGKHWAGLPSATLLQLCLSTLSSFKVMKHLTYSTTTGGSYAFVISFVVSLTNHPVDCVDEWMAYWNNWTQEHPAICTEDYRNLYFHSANHREAIVTGKLFDPELFSSKNKYLKNFLISHDEYTSQSIPADLDSGTLPDTNVYNEPLATMTEKDAENAQIFDKDDASLYMIHASNESMELEEYRPSQRFFVNRKLSRPTTKNISDTSELYIPEKMKSKEKYVRDLGARKLRNVKRNIIRRTKVSGRDAAVSLFARTIHLLKSRRRNLRRDSSNSNEESNRNTMMDTFGSTYDGRRGSKFRFRNSDPSDWDQNKCKSHRRIVKGNTVESAEAFPYIAFVDTGCGGAIIGEKWVLTAGHCVDDTIPTYVHVGSIKLMGGCQYNVDTVYLHPKFARTDLQFDVAVLKTIPDFIFSPAIRPIALSTTSALIESCGTVAGWGMVKHEGMPSDYLLVTTLPIVSKKKCHQLRIKKRQFCAGYDDGSTDTCQGDSGGPFVVDGIVVGIISYGYKCAVPKSPGVYVDVYYHRKWIRHVTGI